MASRESDQDGGGVIERDSGSTSGQRSNQNRAAHVADVDDKDWGDVSDVVIAAEISSEDDREAPRLEGDEGGVRRDQLILAERYLALSHHEDTKARVSSDGSDQYVEDELKRLRRRYDEMPRIPSPSVERHRPSSRRRTHFVESPRLRSPRRAYRTDPSIDFDRERKLRPSSSTSYSSRDSKTVADLRRHRVEVENDRIAQRPYYDRGSQYRLEDKKPTIHSASRAILPNIL